MMTKWQFGLATSMRNSLSHSATSAGG
ncbi:hypothetical protein LINGRAHAP2_LOCUS23944 [Linum grandiflorum]